MRLSRPCYNKVWRCPGWAGGGPKYPKSNRCNNGHIQIDLQDPHWQLKFWPCDTCEITILPYFTKFLSVFWLWKELKWKVQDWRYHFDKR